MKPKELTLRGLILGALITTVFTPAKLAGRLAADIFEVGALDAAFERRDPAV